MHAKKLDLKGIADTLSFVLVLVDSQSRKSLTRHLVYITQFKQETINKTIGRTC